MNNLRRLYNQNRKGIWWVIIIIAFFLIILQVTNYFVGKANKEKSEENETNNIVNIDNESNEQIQLNTDKSVLTGEGLSKTKLNNEVGTIKQFLENCKNNKLEDAYNMLTDECKEEMYASVEDFKEFYSENVFESERVSFEVENWNENTYKVDIIPDMLSTGKSNNGIVKQDYITVKKVNDEYKLNINNYIGRRKINNATKEEKDIVITVNYADTYMEYESYNITVRNKRQEDIALDNLYNEKTMYIEDKNDVKYPAYTHEIPKELLILDKGVERTIDIKYYSRYSSTKNIKNLVFSGVILDYDGHINRGVVGTEVIKIKI